MKRNDPDFYSVLKVQPGASRQTIKAGYVNLMFKMKMHPDLGGDHENAARINEAYAVLSSKPKQSSRMRLLQQLRNASPAACATVRYCPLCGAEQLQSMGPETRCDRCHSPLALPPMLGAKGSEVFGRRASPRTGKGNLGTVYVAGQPQGMTVRLRDLSLSGISFYSEVALDVNQSFRFDDPTLEAVASVVSCRKRGEGFSVHARLLTVAFHNKSGVFVSAEA